MPINIYNKVDSAKVAWLCDDDWELPSQIDSLEKWLRDNHSELTPGKYIADIGFDIRKDACGGGAVFSSESMSIMAKLGIDLYLSEYPEGEDD